MSFLAPAPLVLSSLGLGLVIWRRLGEPPMGSQWATLFATGLLTLHAVLQWWSVLGVSWTWISVGLPLGLVAVAGMQTLPVGSSAGARRGAGLGPGDLTAAAALAVLAIFAANLWMVTPDFVYHWGLKGERFYLAQGLDLAFLTTQANWQIHPDYPNLLPELYALTTASIGGFRAGGMMAWSVVFAAAMVSAARAAIPHRPFAAGIRQLGTAIVALTIVMFGIGHTLGGGADWLIALAPLIALPALLSPPEPRGDFQIGVAAALAASSKMEGLPLALLLITAYLLRHPAARPGRSENRRLAVVARTLLPSLVVVTPWLVQCLRHDLFLDTNTGDFLWSRSATIWQAVWERLWLREWRGMTLALLLLPWLLVVRRTRAAAAVCALQLGFYLFAYYTSPVDTRHLVGTTLPRFVFHVLPTLLTMAFFVLATRPKAGADQESAPSDRPRLDRARQP